MKVGLFYNTCARAGIPVMDAFKEGVQYSGDSAVDCQNPVDNIDVPVIWSILWTNPIRKRVFDYYTKKGKPVLVLEVGGLIRNKSWKVAIGGINSEARFNNQSDHYPERWKKFGLDLKPWKKEGKYIIICGQHEKSGAWNHGSTLEWLGGLIKNIRQHSNKPIIFRPHPRFDVKVPGSFDCTVQKPIFKGNYDCFDLPQVLENTHLLISNNSNPAIEATVNGVHTFVEKSSLCYDVSIKNLKYINNLPCPDRTAWRDNIAHTEWFLEEIKKGIPYKRLRNLL